MNVDDADEYFAVLHQYSQQFDIEETNLIITLESCLCQFQDLDEDEIAELAGEKAYVSLPARDTFVDLGHPDGF